MVGFVDVTAGVALADSLGVVLWDFPGVDCSAVLLFASEGLETDGDGVCRCPINEPRFEEPPRFPLALVAVSSFDALVRALLGVVERLVRDLGVDDFRRGVVALLGVLPRDVPARLERGVVARLFDAACFRGEKAFPRLVTNWLAARLEGETMLCDCGEAPPFLLLTRGELCD